jgi:branched-chain amino acid aminotransferase
VPTRIWIDGVLGGADAGVPALDAGFLFGESVFETMRAIGARVIDLDAHLERLAAGAAALGLAAPAAADLCAALAATVAAAGEPDLRVRAIVTAGRTDVAAAPPVVVVTAEPCPPLSAQLLVLAAVDRPLSDPRTVDPSLKTGSYLVHRLAQRDARALAADEALRLTAAGVVAEGATSNLFAVLDGALVTPPASLGIRAGVTRARVIALARGLGLEVAERTFDAAALYRADEIFVTSSIRGVAPVRRLVSASGRAVDRDAPGVLTQAIIDAYRAFATAEVE